MTEPTNEERSKERNDEYDKNKLAKVRLCAYLLVGETIMFVEPANNADEGLRFIFKSGRVLEMGWCGSEGSMEIDGKEYQLGAF